MKREPPRWGENPPTPCAQLARERASSRAARERHYLHRFWEQSLSRPELRAAGGTRKELQEPRGGRGYREAGAKQGAQRPEAPHGRQLAERRGIPLRGPEEGGRRLRLEFGIIRG